MNRYAYTFFLILFLSSIELFAQKSKVISYEELDKFKFEESSLRTILDSEGDKEKLSRVFANQGQFSCTKDTKIPRLEWCEIETTGLRVNFLAGMAFNLLKLTSGQFSIDYKGQPLSVGMTTSDLKRLFPKLEEARESRLVNKGHFGQRRVDMYVFWIGVENSYATLSFEYEKESEIITDINLFVYN